jgi:hypothetical protein
MDLKERFKKRRALQSELAGKFGWDCFILHVATGRVCPATVENAATHITDGSHRLATQEEIAAYQTDQKLRTEEIAAKSRQISRTNHRIDSKEVDPNARLYLFE